MTANGIIAGKQKILQL